MVVDPNIIPIVAIVFGLPSIALAARWVMKPIIDAYVRGRELKARALADPGQLAAQERRIAELEGELGAMRQELDRLSAVESFYAQLQARPSMGARDLPPGQ